MLRSKLETILTDADKLIHAPPSKNEYEARIFQRQQNALADLKAQFEGVWSVLDVCVAMPTELRLLKEPPPAPPAQPPVNVYDQLTAVAPGINVADCRFSLRTNSCLEEMGVKTLGELSKHAAFDLLEARNFGESSLAEVEQVLKNVGLQLAAEPKGPADKLIADFELSVRDRNNLTRMGILTLGDLAARTEADMLAQQRFGEMSMVTLHELLKAFGLAFKPDGQTPAAPTSTARKLVKPLKRKKRVNSG